MSHDSIEFPMLAHNSGLNFTDRQKWTVRRRITRGDGAGGAMWLPLPPRLGGDARRCRWYRHGQRMRYAAGESHAANSYRACYAAVAGHTRSERRCHWSDCPPVRSVRRSRRSLDSVIICMGLDDLCSVSCVISVLTSSTPVIFVIVRAVHLRRRSLWALCLMWSVVT